MFTTLDTPVVLINEAIVEANIEKCQNYFDSHNIQLRPHIKTHKLPQLAKAQLNAGAVGITCQKISEAECMADAGISDILITYNIVGQLKLDRLLMLSKRIERLSVVADNDVVVQGLSTTFSKSGELLEVLIECDTGGGRCGVQTPEEAVELAALIEQLPGIKFGGLMTYPGINIEPKVQSFLSATLELLALRNIECATVSGGGSPGMWRAHSVPAITEYRVGTYIYGDRSMVHRDVYDWSDCALTVLATVVSTPTADRAIVDVGSKILSTDMLGMDGLGHIVNQPNLKITGLAEEHGIIKCSEGEETGLKVGDRIQIIPNHCCVVSNLAGVVTFHRDGVVQKQQEVLARGLVT